MSVSFLARLRLIRRANGASARSILTTSAFVLRTRVWTGVIALAAVLAVVIFASNWCFTLFIAVVTAWGLHQIAQDVCARPSGRNDAAGVGGRIPAIFMLRGIVPQWWVPAAVIAAVGVLTVGVALKGAAEDAASMSTALLGALYVGVLFPYFALLRNQPQGVRLLIVMLLLIVAGDTGAYLVGVRWGRTRIAPRVSPGKTVEGAVASLAASMAAMMILRGALPELRPRYPRRWFSRCLSICWPRSATWPNPH